MLRRKRKAIGLLLSAITVNSPFCSFIFHYICILSTCLNILVHSSFIFTYVITWKKVSPQSTYYCPALIGFAPARALRGIIMYGENFQIRPLKKPMVWIRRSVSSSLCSHWKYTSRFSQTREVGEFLFVCLVQ